MNQGKKAIVLSTTQLKQIEPFLIRALEEFNVTSTSLNASVNKD